MRPHLSVYLTVCFFLFAGAAAAQGRLKGSVLSGGQPVPFASVGFRDLKAGTVTNEAGEFDIPGVAGGRHQLQVSAVGYVTLTQSVQVRPSGTTPLTVNLEPTSSNLNEVVVSGTLRPVTKMESPVPVEVYSPVFFKKNPTPSIFDALQNVNGVRPQLNCNVCNTGDIHINGLEGPYTMVMIDGMPIVSALSTVYGLSGIPNSLVERVEIVKGPASTLYGSEAVAGLINIITKAPSTAPAFTADVMATSWQEYSADLGMRIRAGTKADALVGVNYFNYQHPVDNNGDGFTDVTLQHRISVFNKWNFKRPESRTATLAARYFYEDRWGGQTSWGKQWRGTDSLYGESIYTGRVEVIGQYQLPVKEHVMLQGSFNYHDQNSYYGQTPFMATQSISFLQLTWDKAVGRHKLLAGLPFRYTYYNDNTVATKEENGNGAQRTFLPGVFLQDEMRLSDKHSLLLGARYDYNSLHGHIFTPRLAYKWTPNYRNVLRLNAGTGYRVVSIFTEDHAALSGAREVVIRSELKPERSWNANLNFTKKVPLSNAFLTLDATAFYTYFNNKIMPDYSLPDTILYDNLQGHAISKGFSLNADLMFSFPLKVIAGVTMMDVYEKTGQDKTRPMLSERFSGTWSVSYSFRRANLSLDYTGNLYGPMLLPVQPLDPRPGTSPWWSIQNIQATKKFAKGWEIYGGVKNLLNFLPPRNSIAHAHDPFDKNVGFNADGSPDPYRLTFDPSYVFAPNQGIRGFLGVRVTKL
ncbi:TonB-dependent receptor [Chitinophaga lutea]